MMEDIQPGRPLEFKITGDGSHTLYLPGLNEHYHSTFGAIAESRHIFLETGYKHIFRTEEPVRILEIGFGTGLNALLTFMESEKLNGKTEYASIELYPLQAEVYVKLNFPDLLNDDSCRKIFLRMHELPWNSKTQLSGNFRILKINTSLELYQPPEAYFDLVYFDAFGPDVQPEMWTLEVFEKMASALRNKGVLVTYSTKGTVRRNLIAAGFSVEKLPGPPGKREILRATRL
jgi:tRNA U34 5-methylaminomethyl-2-thiouridine-forming methyltransferase MnmC